MVNKKKNLMKLNNGHYSFQFIFIFLLIFKNWRIKNRISRCGPFCKLSRMTEREKSLWQIQNKTDYVLRVLRLQVYENCVFCQLAREKIKRRSRRVEKVKKKEWTENNDDHSAYFWAFHFSLLLFVFFTHFHQLISCIKPKSLCELSFCECQRSKSLVNLEKLGAIHTNMDGSVWKVFRNEENVENL